MNKMVEMLFVDDVDAFIKLCELLNLDDRSCPVFLAFGKGGLPHWMMASETIHARLTLFSEVGNISVKQVNTRLEKITFVIRPAEIHWIPQSTTFSSSGEDTCPF